jgi:hypothetical protein
MAEFESLNKVIDSLTPQQWYEIARADENGPLPPCCGNISDLRDDLLALLRCPLSLGAMQLGRALSDHGHDIDGPINGFTAALVAHLDRYRPDWRTAHLPDDDDLAEMNAFMTLARGFKRGDVVPAVEPYEWIARLGPALQLLMVGPLRRDEGTTLAWLDMVRDQLATALRGGAQPRVCLSLYDAARRIGVAGIEPTVAAAGRGGEEAR